MTSIRSENKKHRQLVPTVQKCVPDGMIWWRIDAISIDCVYPVAGRKSATGFLFCWQFGRILRKSAHGVGGGCALRYILVPVVNHDIIMVDNIRLLTRFTAYPVRVIIAAPFPRLDLRYHGDRIHAKTYSNVRGALE